MTHRYCSAAVYFTAFILTTFVSASTAFADDIDIYAQSFNISPGSAHNVILIIDNSYAQGLNPTSTDSNPIELIKHGLRDFISLRPTINLSLITFDGHAREQSSSPEIVLHEALNIGSLDTTTFNSKKLSKRINTLSTSGSNSLSAALYESLRYLRGDTVQLAERRPVNSASRSDLYSSPIQNACQTESSIILVSANQTSPSSGHLSRIKTYLDKLDSSNEYSSGSALCTDQDDCLSGLAGFLSSYDLSDHIGAQHARVHTIALERDIPHLMQTAVAGQGDYYVAKTHQDLSRQLSDITNRVHSSNQSFIAPATSVNVFNRLAHNRDVYFALFEPSSHARWEGNLKKYQFDQTGRIVDVNKQPAIHTTTKNFSPASHSLWSTSRDGNNLRQGGARARQSSPRNLFTYTNHTHPYNTPLNDAANLLSADNPFLKPEMFELDSTKELNTLLNKVQGVTSEDSIPQPFIGDPLHSHPAIVVYGGKDESTQDATLFFGTNEGFLHAIDSTTGKEQFAFIPQQLLPNLAYYQDSTRGVKKYGLDGSITVFKNDLNQNGLVLSEAGQPEQGEGVYLYFGMRRGGQSYFGLDVTDRSAPKLLWRIDGGKGDFTELGQTWSQPVMGRVMINGSKTDVLFFGGGYETKRDDTNYKGSRDRKGRSLYMVDAMTGELIWSAGPNGTDTLRLSEMNSSISSSVNAIDINNDTLTDIIFLASNGGEVWRFDLNHDTSKLSEFASGGMIAQISDQLAPSSNRRFFARPDVARYAPQGGKPYFLIAIGSGNRAAPLSQTTQDRFYVFKDRSSPSDNKMMYELIQSEDLEDVTTSASISKELVSTHPNHSKKQLSGWFINLLGGGQAGEKVLTNATIYAGKLIFTTYTPNLKTHSSECIFSTGQSRLYVLSILSGGPSLDLNNDGTLNDDDRFVDLADSGIAPEANIISIPGFPSEDSKTSEKILCVGPECFHNLFKDDIQIKKIYWREEL